MVPLCPIAQEVPERDPPVGALIGWPEAPVEMAQSLRYEVPQKDRPIPGWPVIGRVPGEASNNPRPCSHSAS